MWITKFQVLDPAPFRPSRPALSVSARGGDHPPLDSRSIVRLEFRTEGQLRGKTEFGFVGPRGLKLKKRHPRRLGEGIVMPSPLGSGFSWGEYALREVMA